MTVPILSIVKTVVASGMEIALWRLKKDLAIPSSWRLGLRQTRRPGGDVGPFGRKVARAGVENYYLGTGNSPKVSLPA